MGMRDPGCTCDCAVCKAGTCIFCNREPHGSREQAVQWFRENPEIARSVQARSTEGQRAIDEALGTTCDVLPRDVS